MEKINVSAERQKKTSLALFWSNFLSEPLLTLYGLLGFILYRDLGASPFAISLMIMLKPIVTVLSFYWSVGLKGKKLKSNALWAGLWMRVPFLLCPWIDESWYVIAAAVNYMFWYRAGVPAWVEILKRNVKRGARERIFSLSSAAAYGEGVILSIGMGALLDQNPTCWKILLFGCALLGLTSLALLSRIEIVEEKEVISTPTSLKEVIVRPWRDGFRLMKENRSFSLFQWGFMISGLGIMLIQPALPLLAVDWLGVNYTEMLVAISIAKGLGFSLSSPLWARYFERVSLLRISSIVFLSVGVFPLLLTLSSFGLGWFYVAYFWYGVGQGGSHLVWNMSGPIFAGKEDSSRYTGVGVVMAGLRGVVGPGLGALLATGWGPIQVLCLGSLLCFYSGIQLFRRQRLAYPTKSS